MTKTFKKSTLAAIVMGSLFFWIVLHIPAIKYGTADLPIHESYIGDEQSPVNGALHILESKNLLGLRNLPTVYYGPVFSMIALPAILADFTFRYMSGAIHNTLAYKDFIIWNWGGIVIFARALAVIAGYLALLAVFFMWRTSTLNPSKNKLIPVGAVLLVGFNYLFFEYASFFKHWIFIIAILLWQIYLLIRTVESPSHSRRYLVIQALLAVISFGISYLGIIYQIMWLPIVFVWFKDRRWQKLLEFAIYLVVVALGCALVIWWHPYAFVRILGLVGIIAPKTSLGSILNLRDQTNAGHSFLYYGRVIFFNNYFLIFAGILMFSIAARVSKVLKDYWFQAIISVAVLNFIIFSIPAHHESRYVLPTVVLLPIIVYALFSQSYGYLDFKKPAVRIVGLFLALSILVNIIQIAGWERMIGAGPSERQIFPTITSWQNAEPKTKILLYQNWLLGHVHSKAAYEDYVKKFNKTGFDLWQYILTLASPQNTVLFNVYYRHTDQPLTSVEISAYDHVIVDHPAEMEQDQFDVKPWTVWNYKKYQDSYSIVK